MTKNYLFIKQTTLLNVIFLRAILKTIALLRVGKVPLDTPFRITSMILFIHKRIS